MPQTSSRPAARVIALAAVLDFVLVVVFCLIGRASHHEGALSLGLLTTAWPFVVGLVGGWVLAGAVFRGGWRAPTAPLRTGVVIWIVTVVIGMVLRVASGQGVQVSFVIVASLVLGVFLVGWRAIALLAGRRRSGADAAPRGHARS